MLYKFDLEYFLTSKLYIEIADNYLTIITNKIKTYEEQYKEITEILILIKITLVGERGLKIKNVRYSVQIVNICIE